MPTHAIRARPPRGGNGGGMLRRDPDLLSGFLEDAAHFPGGHAEAIAAPSSEVEIAEILRAAKHVLPIGAQSSLTGGATPMGDVLVTTSRFNRIIDVRERAVRVQAGVTLAELDAALQRAGKYYPPAPTFMGAFVGGVVATNAAGAATFKYGTTRDWVRALTVVLANGDVLEVDRGATRAHPSGYFDLQLSDGEVRVPVPDYRMPRVPKVSAGYFAAPDMDLIDLFIGSEGTLGIITDVTLRIVPWRPAICLAFVPFADRAAALSFVEMLRYIAIDTWQTHNPRGMDISAIEHMDGRCLALVREDGADRTFGVRIPESASIALLITLELPTGTSAEQAFDQIGRFRDLDMPLPRLCRALEAAGVFDDVEIAVPGDTGRAAQLLGLREAVPAAVNARVGRAKAADPRIAKTAADMIVPFDRLPEMLRAYDTEFGGRGLDAAIWGHISDGNLHPNVVPRSWADVEAGTDAILACGREVLRLGGSPLAEHGVGRNKVKQSLLRELYGTSGIDAMRAVKRALDPAFKLSSGVIFDPHPPGG